MLAKCDCKDLASGSGQFSNHAAKISTRGLIPDTICLRVIIICRYVLLRFWLKTHFTSTKFCDTYEELLQGRHIVIFYGAYG